MKKIVLASLLIVLQAGWMNASDNVFQQSEDEVYYQTNSGPGFGGLGGGDPEPAPIDGYLPLLGVLGLSLLYYVNRKRKQTA